MSALSDGTCLGSAASAINASGQIAGECYFRTTNDAVVWSGSTLRNLGTLSGLLGAASGINDFGDVAGGANSPSSGESEAFGWFGNGLEPLGTFSPEFPESWAYGINDENQIVGTAISGTSISSVPEPTSVIFMSAALLSVAFVARKSVTAR